MGIDLASVLIGIIIAAATLAYQQGWIPPKYHLAGFDLMKDPLTLKLFGPPEDFEKNPRQPRVIPRHMVPQYKRDGFKIVREIYSCESFVGREIVWVGKVSDGSIQETVLVARPK